MSIGPQDAFLLDQWGRQLRDAFGVTPYLVGSVARAEAVWRDVDVRMLCGDWPAENPARLAALNLSVTLWGRQVTGLPIDFQFQPPREWDSHDGIRNPLGGRSQVKWHTDTGDAG